jgi:NADH-ubiquinone oxidoreductase chain 6
MFIRSFHPVTLIFFILTQTLVICLLTWTILKIRWFSYILFLVFLGGLIVLFIYITSLASNEKIFFSLKPSLVVLIVSLLLIVIPTSLNRTPEYKYFLSSIKSFYSIYSRPLFLPTIVAIIYLLFTLIVVVKVASKYEAPIKNTIFNKQF